MGSLYQKQMRELILSTAGQVGSPARAVFLGPERLEEAPIKKLAPRFEKIFIFNLNLQSKRRYQKIPKITFQEKDLSGGLWKSILPIFCSAQKRTLDWVLEALILIWRGYRTEPATHQKFEYVVSINVASAIQAVFRNHVIQRLFAIAGIFEPGEFTSFVARESALFSKWKEFMRVHSDLEEKILLHHFRSLHAMAKKGGVILFADTLFSIIGKERRPLYPKAVIEQMDQFFPSFEKRIIVWPQSSKSWEVHSFVGTKENFAPRSMPCFSNHP